MSNRILTSSKILSADQVPDYERWTPGQLTSTGEQTRVKPRTLKDITESMLDKIVEAALQDAQLNELQSLNEPEPEPDPLDLIPPEILEEAKQKAYQEGLEQGLNEGKQQGLEQGYAEGYQSGVEAVTTELHQIQQLAQQASSTFEQFEETIAPQLLKLAVTISEQVLRREINTPSDAIVSVIRSAFDEMIGTEDLKRLHLNPQDIEIVKHHLGDELNLGAWTIVPDEEITAGGCLIKTRQVNIDAQVETCWQRVMTSLGIEHPLQLNADDSSVGENTSPKKNTRTKKSATPIAPDEESSS